MATPSDETAELSFPAIPPDQADNSLGGHPLHQRSSDEDGTLQGEVPDHGEHSYLRVETDVGGHDHDHNNGPDVHFVSPLSPSQNREKHSRLDDDLTLLQAEQMVDRAELQRDRSGDSRGSISRTRSRTAHEPVDDFDISTNPIHEITKVYQPPARPATKFAKVFKKIHETSFLVRYFFYITPVMLLLLIPTLLGLFVFKRSTVGDVELFWFGIWLEIVWLTLWLSRIISRMIPYPMGMISSLFTNNAKKWRDLGKQLEVPATIFFWLLAIEISFLPTMKNHHLSGNSGTHSWEITTNKVIIAIFVAAGLNFIEKIIIQLIAISFHLRTYADRIELNKFQIASLVKLYVYSKEKIAMEDEEFQQAPETGPSSGTRTPKVYVEKVQRNAVHALNKVGDVAGRVAGDFTGRAVAGSTHPHQVVLSLLNSTNGSQVLARRLYRTYAQENSEVVFPGDLRHAFDNDDEADAAFTMFDKDMNGDISMEELEAVCVEIGRERKAITASLKDLDSVVSKLDNVFVFIVIIITILVFVSLISVSASTALTSLGSTVLALSWLFSATAQEFLQSLIFVFVKHPFDVGDRVTIYGNTGSQLKGDDYFVKEISLLFTEFKKMEGHVVQAPNSYLNTLFILNQRRSGGLAEAVPLTVKFGTTLDQIDGLRRTLLEFVGSENREYQKNILTEITTITEAYSVSLNVVFFYKSNWQNELLRLQRRNKFICALMVSMQEMGIEGPRLGPVPGATQDYPMFVHNNHPPPTVAGPATDYKSPDAGHGRISFSRDEPIVAPPSNQQPDQRHPSILRHRGFSTSRQRRESISEMGKRVDFSLGMRDISSGADMGDIYEKPKPRIPSIVATSPSPVGRTSKDTARPSEEGGSIAHSTSRESQLGKISSANSLRLHKNRFFGRGKSKPDLAEDGTDLEDLEAGTRDVGLPNIPETSAFTTPINEYNSSAKQQARGLDAGVTPSEDKPVPFFQGSATRDPRTGVVGSQAVRDDLDNERARPPLSTGANQTLGEASKKSP